LTTFVVGFQSPSATSVNIFPLRKSFLFNIHPSPIAIGHYLYDIMDGSAITFNP